MNKSIYKDLIGKNETQKAIKVLLEEQIKESFRDKVILLKSRLKELDNKLNAGILSNQDYNIAKNQINFSLMNIINEYNTGEDNSRDLEGTNTKKSKLWQLIVGLGVIVGIVAGIVAIVDFSQKQHTPEQEKTEKVEPLNPEEEAPATEIPKKTIEKEEIKPSPSPPSKTLKVEQSTQGKQSPNVVNDGDGPVIINYGDWTEGKKDTTQNQ